MNGIEVKYKINGREVPFNKIGDEMTKQFFLKVREIIYEALKSVQCPVHGQAPEVTVEGTSLDNLVFHINGCCERVIDESKKRLSSIT